MGHGFSASHGFHLSPGTGRGGGLVRDVLGFVVVREFRGDDGGVAHAEVRRGDAVVCIQRRPGLRRSRSERRVRELRVVRRGRPFHVAAIHDRAVGAGTRVLIGPETTPWGNSRVELLDPQGRQWSIGTYLPQRGPTVVSVSVEPCG
jgi:uncharacterized glyoxalase superfamily protein PhnB